jgi:hypothetical protein
MTRLLAIHREKAYSPGRHQSNDPLLLEQVADRLRAGGLAVGVRTMAEVKGEWREAALIFSMCQGRAALDRLAEWEGEGARIVNRPGAAINTYRDRLPALMRAAGVPFPETELVSTAGPPGPKGPGLRAIDGVGPGSIERRLWLKRGGVHASVSADVQSVDSAAALERGLAEFASRGIELAAVQAHCPGDEIKFYGVGSGDFFHWFHPGQARSTPFDSMELTSLASLAARAAGLEIFGGDAIVSPSGALTLIDLNDWPSFAPCRDAAADAIADHLTRRIHAVWNPGLVSTAGQSAV